MVHQSIDPKSINSLPKIRAKIISSKDEYVSLNEKFIRPYCVVFLDQTFLKIRRKKNILLLPFHSNVHQYLKQCSFEFLYGNCPNATMFDQENIVSLKRFLGTPVQIEDEVIAWIQEKIFRFMPKLDNKLNKRIVQSLWEIIQNALIHSDNDNGVSVCGQFYPKRGYFEIAFCDYGIGLVQKIKNAGLLNNSHVDSDYIEWAMERGNTTLKIPNAGLGLFILRKFLKINQGSFQIISGNGYFGHISNENEEKRNLQNFLDGTLVNLRIIFDQNIYLLKE